MKKSPTSKAAASNHQQYIVRHEDFLVGFLQLDRHDETTSFGRLKLVESIIHRVGWKAQRVATALDAFATYMSLAAEEGVNSKSKKMRAALAQIEKGEVGHYLLPDGWHVLDETRHARGIDLLDYREDGRVAWSWRDEADLKEYTAPPMPAFAPALDLLRFRLLFQEAGRHRFGGPAKHGGVIPKGSTVPLHHFLTIDLADLRSPFHYQSGAIRYLPCYYPLAYGEGGASVQYQVCSDNRIQIIHLSDPAPDKGRAYVKVPCLPPTQAKILELTYEELRVRAFRDHPSCEGLNPDDEAVWNKLGGNKAMVFGGAPPPNSGSMTCKNPGCKSFDSVINLEVILCIPPISINGRTDFWHEFDGASVQFYFGLCPSCRDVIAFNVCD